MRVLVVYASADGSTKEIAERIAACLSERGFQVVVQPARQVGDIEGFDAIVVGSAVHARQWLGDATVFVNRYRQILARQPLWTFSVGMPEALPRVVRKMARTEETAIMAELGDLRPVGHQLFSGVVKPSQFPFASRVFLRLAGGRYGDFRDWGAIEQWAGGIADHLDALDAQARRAQRARTDG